MSIEFGIGCGILATVRDLSERSLTAGYISALGLVAMLTIAAHVTLDKVIAAHEGSAAVINVSGRQRMLSQRIASLAAQYRLGSPTARDDLLGAVNLFEAAHHKLLTDAAMLAQDDPGAIRGIYFGGGMPLDDEVAGYVHLARHIAEAPRNAPGVDASLTRLFAEARAPLLQRLDDVVQYHQHDSETQMSRLQVLQRITLGIVLVTLATEALLIFRPMVRRIGRSARELTALATIDSLTGTLNRRSFFERGQAEMVRARRSGRTISVLMLDIDHFKRINDTFGHAGGDAALQALARTLSGAVRQGDLIGRMGGEEFAVLLPETTLDDAYGIAERLRVAITCLAISHAGRPIRLTMSVGVAAAQADETDVTMLLREADLALYAAKSGGRNRVVADSARMMLEA